MERAEKDQLERVINHELRKRFGPGAVQRAVLLEHGENPAIGPGQQMLRVFVPAPDEPAGYEQALAAWLADPALPKVLHDAKGPLHAFAARGFTLAGLECDTALAAYLALPGQRTFDLADLTLRYTGQELREEPADGQLTLDGSVERDAAAGLVLRAQATL